VAHVEGRPFQVRTAHTVAEDRGTRFDIRAYPVDAEARVVVAEGEVAVSGAPGGSAAGGDGPVLVRGGSVAYADSVGGVRVAPGVAADSYLAWTRGELRFVGTPLPEALAQLGRWYDIDLRLGDTRLETKSLTASFRADPVDDVVHTLERVLSVRVQRDGRTMTLYPT
jgi:transmembrane sensor